MTISRQEDLVPADAPAQSDVDAAITHAQRKISSAGDAGSGASAKAAKLQSQARGYVAQAAALCRQYGDGG